MFGGGEGGVGTHAAIGVVGAEVGGAVDRMAGGDGGIEGGGFDQIGVEVLGEGDFAGGGVGAFLEAVEFAGQLVDLMAHKPVSNGTTHRFPPFNVALAEVVVGFSKGGFERGDVAAVAVEEEEAAESRLSEGGDQVADH